MYEAKRAPDRVATMISEALRQRRVVSDAEFDRLFPARHHVRSSTHWTPVEIAIRAGSLLAPEPGARVLDVGSGVGKVCLIGALTTGARWTGAERDARMIDLARRAASRVAIADRVAFIHDDATTLDWSKFDAVYLFNPFSEVLIDRELDPLERRDRFGEIVQHAQRRLAETRPGTRVVTYHGFGGEMPEGFTLQDRQPAGSDELCLWVRRGAPGASGRVPGSSS